MPPPSPKRQKTSSIESDLICSITKKLPVDPVYAEDGRVYERTAIESYIEDHKEDLKSPATEAAMGERLFPALQHKNIIQTLVGNGTIAGDLADQWKEKQEMKNLLNKAEQGDTDAMKKVALGYYRGLYKFEQDDEKAFHWFQKGHEAGCLWGTATLAQMFIHGFGVPKNESMGAVFYGIAAGGGHAKAAHELGRAFMKGMYGLPVNIAEATRLLEQSLEEPTLYGPMNSWDKGHARYCLERLRNDPLAFVGKNKDEFGLVYGP
jgi:U-box domain/Sel1 repeat